MDWTEVIMPASVAINAARNRVTENLRFPEEG